MRAPHCEVCGAALKSNGVGTEWCQLCYEVADRINPAVVEWVQTVAKKAAEDALRDADRAEGREG